ncbi:hypothetical protein KOR42_03600 [Thalassoglobus neptunius]|uniref:Uncharacterized protein n=1 Tax=Thalassoglobus neptunius TaxID=1938619 RepID=A0A5C5X451_9PLAN|nr:hypothetical protein [Thalassoglobus neptunius]TWT57003.1 hypothetical protein KOR42_03600 [Thalassoglobus neptunius]
MDYRFKPISKTCAGTGEPLVPGEICYSALIEKDGSYDREDYSEAGWNGLPEGGIGFWKCIVPQPEQKSVSAIDPESLLQYFEQIVDQTNPQQQKLTYVLALSLLQRRRLKLDGSTVRDDVEYLQLSGVRGEGPYEVRDQQIPESELQQLQSALNEQLSSQWDAA